MKHKDGREYKGDWLKDQMHGKGTFQWPSGEFYEGSYFDDQKHGPGKILYKDGSKY